MADAGVVPYETQVAGNLLSNDSDPDQGTISLTQYTIAGNGTVYLPGQTANISGVGSISISSVGAYTFTPDAGFSGVVPVISYTVSNGSLSSVSTLTLQVATAPTNVLSDPVSTSLTGSHTTYNVYSDTDMNNIPWGSLTAGDVVNIHWKSTPYRAKFALRGSGTALNPIVINGVTNGSGERPKFNWSTGAFTASGCNPSGGYSGPNDIFSSTPEYGEGLGGFVIKRGPQDPYGTYVPKWIVIKNIHFEAGRGSYTNLAGGTSNFVGVNSFGSNIYLLSSEDCTFENCISNDSGFGFFTQANGEGLAFTSTRLTVRNCRFYGNGINNSFLEHNLYVQAASPLIEGNYIGQLRSGALGSTYKSRSSGEIFRYNWVETSARAMDFVQSEDNPGGIPAQPDYPIVWCYGNVIINSNDLSLGVATAPVHLGGDNAGEQDSSATEFVPNPNSVYRTTMYFWNNTYYQKANSADVYRACFFDLSLRNTTVYAWSNIFYCTGTTRFSYVEYAGQLHLLGNNIVYGTVYDSHESAASVNFNVFKTGTILTTDPLFTDLATREFFLTYSSPAIDLAVSYPSGLPDSTINSKTVVYQPRKATNGLVVRTKDSTYFDLGATEYGIGYTPPAPPAPSVTSNPSISGDTRQGQPLSCSQGVWLGRPVLTYQWKRDGVDISGATSNVYTTTIDDFHKNISCIVTGTNPTDTFSFTTNSIYVVSHQAPFASIDPELTGTFTEGYTVSCSTGWWSNSPASYAYQWQLDGSDIVGATASSYTIQIGQSGHLLRCKVTATNEFDSGVAYSEPESVAAAPSDPDQNGTWNFSATNGTNLAALSLNWVSVGSLSTQRFECLNGALQCVAGTGSNGEAVYITNGLGNDQFTEVRLLPDRAGSWIIALQQTGVQSGYSASFTTSNVTLYKGGVWQGVYPYSVSNAVDLVIQLNKTGTTFTCNLNGTQLFSFSDGTEITGGGIFFSFIPGADVSKLRMDYLKTANV